MIVNGSINYSFSGRRRRTVSSKKKKAVFKELKPKSRRTEQRYPSAPLTPYVDPKKVDRTANKTYTVAPAYNKGAYQVISHDNIKDIGR